MVKYAGWDNDNIKRDILKHIEKDNEKKIQKTHWVNLSPNIYQLPTLTFISVVHIKWVARKKYKKFLPSKIYSIFIVLILIESIQLSLNNVRNRGRRKLILVEHILYIRKK